MPESAPDIAAQVDRMSREELLYLAADGQWTPRQIAFARWRAACRAADAAGARYMAALRATGAVLAGLAGDQPYTPARQLEYATARLTEDRLRRAEERARRREQRLWAEYRALVD